ncbi:MAG: ABC-2 transporter permease [Clostridium sp.]|nr:ABC-2 transporter permease [Acetatifactor muris]MCM1527679.1 ABC-2 transporter permease [Bacteroides sp.]MCM1563377.1 ABC-2 transporter permease [Clostridium sp.]
MLGLLSKDFRLIKNQGILMLAVMVVAGIGFAYGTGNPASGVGYLTMIGTLYCLNTISYDGYDNGYAFLFTLPVSPRMYAAEKYVLTLILSSVSCAVSAVVTELYVNEPSGLGERMFIYPGIWIAMLCVAGLMIPIHLKFGAEKGRILSVFGCALIFLGVYLLRALDQEKVKAVFDAIDAFTERVGDVGVLAAVAVFVVGFCLISLLISMRVMSRKEF